MTEDFVMSRIVKLTPPRRALIAFLEHAKEIPTVPVARQINLSDLMNARAQITQPPSWSAIFMRAYALVSGPFNQLRRSWLSWPYARMYEHPVSVCSVAVEREWQGERYVFYGKVEQPEERTLEFVNDALLHLQTEEIRKVRAFRNVLRLGKLPLFLQRLALSAHDDFSGPRRVRSLGTFALSNYGMLGAESLHPIGLNTTILTLGPISPKADVTVKVVYDHRILDGGYVARALGHLDEVLHTTILAELRERIRRTA